MFVQEDAEILLVSGLALSDCSSGLLPTQLLVDYITGQLGSGVVQRQAATVARVIIAGECHICYILHLFQWDMDVLVLCTFINIFYLVY